MTRIILGETEFKLLVTGQVVRFDKGEVQIVLQDISYAKMMEIVMKSDQVNNCETKPANLNPFRLY